MPGVSGLGISTMSIFTGTRWVILVKLPDGLGVGRSAKRAVVALPGEKIIRVGGPPDSMYFIAAGEVTVMLPNFQVTLKEGDFVGEMGLISDRPRSADVVSDGYCHLLALYRKDFRALLDKRPTVRAEIEAMAARRIAENEGKATAS